MRAGRFEGGWSVEMQIPFKSMRYRPGTSQVWGVQLRRGIRRRNEWAFITPLPPTDGSAAWQRLSMAATLVGLEVPPGSKNVEIKPYGISTMSTNRVATPATANDVDAEAGLDLKYGVTQNLTLDFTYNTDFAQVEADEQQINLTRFNLVFPEKREFFLEGRGLFEFGRPGRVGGGALAGGNAPDLFFSRQIGLNQGQVVPIIGGGRLTGKVGRLSIGALNIQTDHEPVSATPATNFTVIRAKQDVLRRGSVGAMFTGRSQSVRTAHSSNTAYGLDGTFSFFENVNVTGYYARTATDGLSGNQESYYSRFDYNADRYGLQVDHLLVGDAFNPEVGFVRRDNMRRTSATGRFSPRMRSKRSVRRLVWQGGVEYIENLAGQLETRQRSLGFEVEFQNSDRISVDAGGEYEFLARPFLVGEGVSIPAGAYSFETLQTSFALGQQHRTSGTFSVGVGEFYDGTQTSVGFTQGRISVSRQLALEPSVTINWIELPYGAFTTELYRMRVTHAFTPRMFLSGLIQDNSSSDTIGTNLRLRWEYTPGSELFIVYTEDQGTQTGRREFARLVNRALAIKVNRLFRF